MIRDFLKAESTRLGAPYFAMGTTGGWRSVSGKMSEWYKEKPYFRSTNEAFAADSFVGTSGPITKEPKYPFYINCKTGAVTYPTLNTTLSFKEVFGEEW